MQHLFKSPTLSKGPWSRGYYTLYAVRNKTLVLKFARVDVVLDSRLYILKMGRLCCSAARYENRVAKGSKGLKACVPLPVSRSYHATAIMGVYCSFTHLRRPRSPPTFNQFFIVLPRTPL